MAIEIVNKSQLESIIYTWFNENENCIIEIKDKYAGGYIYFTSSKLPDGNVLLSLCVESRSIGDVVNPNDGKAKMKFIKEKCGIIDFGKAHLIVSLKTNNESDTLNYIDSYLKFHSETKETTPILITRMADAICLFSKFVWNDECNKLIFSFSIPISDLNYDFTLDLVIDKISIYDAQFICFNTVREDMDNASTIVLYPDGYIEEIHPDLSMFFRTDSEKNMKELSFRFIDNMLDTFERLTYLSDEEIEIYAYSNCNLI